MKAVHLALCSLLLSSLAPGPARAAEAPAAPSEATLRALVERDFLEPLAESQRDRSFSPGAAPRTREFRIGTLRASLVRDARGQAFATFTLDQRFTGEPEWSAATLVGCVYPQDGTIFVQKDGGYVAPSYFVGKPSNKPPAGVCEAAGAAQKKRRTLATDQRRILEASMHQRFTRLPANSAGGAKLTGRAAVNPALSVNEAFNVELFGRLLAARFGPPDHGGDADYSYSIRDKQSGIEFEAYSAGSGPAYGGSPPECMVDFANNDYRIKPTVLKALADFEKWLTEPKDDAGN